MIEQIKNIYCVGRNYKLHAAELGNDVPAAPMLFSKPTHALIEMNGQEIKLPDKRGDVHFETELVVRVGSDYDSASPTVAAIDGLALGIDFTLRDVQSEIKRKGHPWLLAKGFKRSAPITPFIPFPGMNALKETPFTLHVNGAEKQRGVASDMIFDLQTILEFCEGNFGLGTGDIIFTGTPEGVGSVHDGDHFKVSWGSLSGEFRVKLK